MNILVKALRDDRQFDLRLELLAGHDGLGREIASPHIQKTGLAIAGFIESTPRVIWSLNTQVPPEKAVFPARSGRKPIEHTIHVPKGKGRQLLAQLAAHGYTKK